VRGRLEKGAAAVKRWLVGLCALALAVSLSTPATGDQSQGGFSSKDVKWVKWFPNEIGTLTGARIVGNYLYMTSWRGFSIYDVSKPLAPKLESQTFWGQYGDDPGEFESEDMPTNGKILIMSETVPRNVLHVFDVSDKSNPKEIATEATPVGSDYDWANHTMSCLFDCTWLYGSAGSIVDLHDPAHPKLIQHNWNDGLKGQSGHDVVEVKPGFVLTATEPIMYLDARDPVHPKVLALGHAKDDRFIHSVLWPQDASDKFILASGETNFRPTCGDTNGDFQTWDASDWEQTHTFRMIDEQHVEMGDYEDGNPPLHGLGCSTHWFDTHPAFDDGEEGRGRGNQE